MPKNPGQTALTAELVDTIRELQSLSSLDSFSVAGGTNLALRFNYRKSVDIDLFSNQIIGVAGLLAVKSEIKAFYGSDLLACELVNTEFGDQSYHSLRRECL